MKCIPNYRVGYNGEFYEAGQPFEINSKDAVEMRKHGKVLDDSTPPSAEAKKPGRPRRVEHGQSGKAEIKDRRS